MGYAGRDERRAVLLEGLKRKRATKKAAPKVKRAVASNKKRAVVTKARKQGPLV